MTAKTNQEWQAENSHLTFKLNNLKQNFDKLSEEHKILQTKLILETEKTKDNRNKCDINLEKVTNVKKLRNYQKSTTRVFKCDKCEKEFYEEWKLRAHVKSHNNFKCEKCEKTFVYLDIKKKHVLIAHENVKLYCHFFNNKKTCPFNDKCIFLHQDSKFCKYDILCERDLCMFKHKEKNLPVNEESCDYHDDENDIIEIQSEYEDDAQEDEIYEEDDTVNKTFINPTQVDNTDFERMIKCDTCDFQTKSKSEVNTHKATSHNWCEFCYSSFISHEKLNNHKKKKHNKH